jgi:hypothetical protein
VTNPSRRRTDEMCARLNHQGQPGKFLIIFIIINEIKGQRHGDGNDGPDLCQEKPVYFRSSSTVSDHELVSILACTEEKRDGEHMQE